MVSSVLRSRLSKLELSTGDQRRLIVVTAHQDMDSDELLAQHRVTPGRQDLVVRIDRFFPGPVTVTVNGVLQSARV